MVLMGICAALLVGFCAGLFAFKIKLRWCPTCGETLKCVACTIRRTYASPDAMKPNAGKW